MKVIQKEPEFRPMTLLIESKEERDRLIDTLEFVTRSNSQSPSRKAFVHDIIDLLNNPSKS